MKPTPLRRPLQPISGNANVTNPRKRRLSPLASIEEAREAQNKRQKTIPRIGRPPADPSRIRLNYEPPPRAAEKPRRSFTREQKLEVIAYLWNYRKHDVSFLQTGRKVKCRKGQSWYDAEHRPPTYEEAATHFGYAFNNVKRWWETQNDIATQKSGTRSDNSRVQKEHLPQIEYELFKLLNGVRDLGQSVTKKLLIRRGNRLVFKYFPDVGFKFSDGWFARFKRRWGISWRRKTKQSQLKPEEIQTYVNNWLSFFRRNNLKAELLPYAIDNGRPGLLRFSIPIPDDVSRFASQVIINMDETPLPFEITSNCTYNLTGAQTICIKTAKSGWDKRQATLVLGLVLMATSLRQ